MENYAQQRLNEILRNNGLSLLEYPQRCRELLLKDGQVLPREAYALTAVLKHRAPQKLLEGRGTIADQVLLARVCAYVLEHLPLSNQAAGWAVESWALALSVISQPALAVASLPTSTISLSEAPRQALAGILAKRGSALLDEPRRCEGFLRDSSGDKLREISALTAALELKIPQKLLHQDPTSSSDILTELAIEILESTFFSEEAAHWAVESWSEALQTAELRTTTKKAAVSVRAPQKPRRQKITYLGLTFQGSLRKLTAEVGSSLPIRRRLTKKTFDPGEMVERLLAVQPGQRLIFFTDRGRVYELSSNQAFKAASRKRNQGILQLLKMHKDEYIISMLSFPGAAPREAAILFCTALGRAKRLPVDSILSSNLSGSKVLSLRKGDRLCFAQIASPEYEILLISAMGWVQRLPMRAPLVSSLQSMGKEIFSLADRDIPAGILVIPPRLDEGRLILVTEKGYAKQVLLTEFRKNKRRVVPDDLPLLGRIAASGLLNGEQAGLLLVTSRGRSRLVDAPSIPLRGRRARGEKLIQIESNDQLATVLLTTGLDYAGPTTLITPLTLVKPDLAPGLTAPQVRIQPSQGTRRPQARRRLSGSVSPVVIPSRPAPKKPPRARLNWFWISLLAILLLAGCAFLTYSLFSSLLH